MKPATLVAGLEDDDAVGRRVERGLQPGDRGLELVAVALRQDERADQVLERRQRDREDRERGEPGLDVDERDRDRHDRGQHLVGKDGDEGLPDHARGTRVRST